MKVQKRSADHRRIIPALNPSTVIEAIQVRRQAVRPGKAATIEVTSKLGDRRIAVPTLVVQSMAIGHPRTVDLELIRAIVDHELHVRQGNVAKRLARDVAVVGIRPVQKPVAAHRISAGEGPVGDRVIELTAKSHSRGHDGFDVIVIARTAIAQDFRTAAGTG